MLINDVDGELHLDTAAHKATQHDMRCQFKQHMRGHYYESASTMRAESALQVYLWRAILARRVSQTAMHASSRLYFHTDTA